MEAYAFARHPVAAPRCFGLGAFDARQQQNGWLANMLQRASALDENTNFFPFCRADGLRQFHQPQQALGATPRPKRFTGRQGLLELPLELGYIVRDDSLAISLRRTMFTSSVAHRDSLWVTKVASFLSSCHLALRRPWRFPTAVSEVP